MHVKKSSVNETTTKFVMSADGVYLEPIRQRVVRRLGSQVKLPGFRAGKAPLNLVEKNLDQAILQSEFMDEAMTEMYSSALSEHNVRPVARPQVKVTKFVPFTDLEFEAEVETIGEVKLGDYKKIKKDKPTVKVRESDVADVLNSLQERAAERKDVTRAAKKEDQVRIDFKGVDAKGEPVSGAEGKDYPLVLGSNTFIPGFEDNLIGMKPEKTKTFTLTFPKDYGVKALASKKVTFTVKVNKVQEIVKETLDDTFAQKLGPFKTLDELKADIEKQLHQERTNERQHELENEIIKEIVAKSEVALPESLIDEQVERLNQELRQNLMYRGQTYQEFLESEDKSEEEYKKEVLRPQAEERVKAGLVLSEVAEQENLTVTPEELEIRLQVLKGQYTDAAMQTELDKPESRRDIASRILTEKTISKLIGYATKG